MDNKSIEKVFLQFSDEKTKRIVEGNYLPALQALGMPAQWQQLFAEVDIDQDGGLDLDEFVRAVRHPSELETWCATLPLAKLLACCLDSEGGGDESPDPVRSRVSTLSPEDIDKVAGEFHRGLKRLLEERARELERCYAELDRKAAEAADGSNSKFTFEFSAGSPKDFHAGLNDRVGELTASVLIEPSAGLRSRRR